MLCTNHFKTMARTSSGVVDNRMDQVGVIPTSISPAKLAPLTFKSIAGSPWRAHSPSSVVYLGRKWLHAERARFWEL
jgi:hypothetical protein